VSLARPPSSGRVSGLDCHVCHAISSGAGLPRPRSATPSGPCDMPSGREATRHPREGAPRRPPPLYPHTVFAARHVLGPARGKAWWKAFFERASAPSSMCDAFPRDGPLSLSFSPSPFLSLSPLSLSSLWCPASPPPRCFFFFFFFF
jgi:hypothetical protein